VEKMPAKTPAPDWTFVDAADARAYLADLVRLWVGWLVALAALLVFDGLMLLVTAVGVVVGWFVLARPFSRRAAALAGNEPSPAAGQEDATAQGKERDRYLRELTSGRAPLEAAVRDAGVSERWVYLRYVVIAATIVGFVLVFRGFVGGG